MITKVSIPSLETLRETYERKAKDKELSEAEFIIATYKLFHDFKRSSSLPRNIYPGAVVHLDRMQMEHLVSTFKQSAAEHTKDNHKYCEFVSLFVDAGLKGERCDIPPLPKAA